MNSTNCHKTIYLSHGGGPLPLLGDEGHQEMVSRLREIASQFPRPAAILVISAHWEEMQPTLTAGLSPGLLYDYSGFPEEAHKLSYPAPGAPGLAQKVFDSLHAAGLQPAKDIGRGFDHGLYVPLKIMYPEANIPCVQLSLVRTLNPEVHIRMGEALSQIDHEGLLIIGSGFSFHNMQAFFRKSNSDDSVKNLAFEKWLIETISSREIDEDTRRKRLINWQQAPHARFCHPREEHLLPLHACYGIHGTACSQALEMNILGKKASFFLW